MYDPAAQLIVLREKSNNSPNLIKMMRDYKVPVGMSEDEMAKATEYFDKNKKVDKKWYQVWKKKNKM
jgi:hypothetical protein